MSDKWDRLRDEHPSAYVMAGKAQELLAERDAFLEALENIASGEVYPVQIAVSAIEAAKRREGVSDE